MSVAPVAPPNAWAESRPRAAVRLLSRIATFCLVELQKLRHDRTELVTRAIQPVLWLVIFGQTFSRIRAIPTGDVPYLDYLAPGIIAQSALFVAIFYGIQIIWERDARVPRWWPARRSRPACGPSPKRSSSLSSPRCSASA